MLFNGCKGNENEDPLGDDLGGNSSETMMMETLETPEVQLLHNIHVHTLKDTMCVCTCVCNNYFSVYT